MEAKNIILGCWRPRPISSGSDSSPWLTALASGADNWETMSWLVSVKEGKLYQNTEFPGAGTVPLVWGCSDSRASGMLACVIMDSDTFSHFIAAFLGQGRGPGTSSLNWQNCYCNWPSRSLHQLCVWGEAGLTFRPQQNSEVNHQVIIFKNKNYNINHIVTPGLTSSPFHL
jgi:hypothetical protein